MVKNPGKPARSFENPRQVKQNKPKAILALLNEWLQDESGYDEDTWPELKAALDRDRLPTRKLFDE